MISLVIMCIVLTAFINPKYRRKEADTDQSLTENDHLLNVNVKKIKKANANDE